MKTLPLVGLLAFGFMALVIGWPWWIGVGIILISMALAVSEEGTPAVSPRSSPQPQGAIQERKGQQAVPPEPLWKALQEKEPTGSVQDPLHFRPSIPPDGIAGIGSVGPGSADPIAKNLSVGKRTGTVSFYFDSPDDPPLSERARVRLKDDLRLNLPFMNEKDVFGDTKPFASLFTSHFRTGKSIIKTKMLEPTFETIKTGFDEWAKED